MTRHLVLIVALAAAAACEFGYPEVVVVNRSGEPILLKNPSFSGCLWETVLGYEETTSPGRCLPGEDRVHFQKLDTAAVSEEEPVWFNYQTISSWRVDYGGFYLFEITADDLEQDFSVPGPYGH